MPDNAQAAFSNPVYQELDALSGKIAPELIAFCQKSVEIAVSAHVLREFNKEIGPNFSNNIYSKSSDGKDEFEKILTRSRSILKSSIILFPSDFRLYLWLGMIDLLRADHDSALLCFEVAGAWFSGNTLAFHYASRLHHMNGRSAAAEERAVAALFGEPCFRPSLSYLARISKLAIPFPLARVAAAALKFNPAWLYGGSFAAAALEVSVKRKRLILSEEGGIDLDAVKQELMHAYYKARKKIEEEEHYSIGKIALLWENYFGYSLFAWEGRYYGLPASESHKSPEIIKEIDDGVRCAAYGAPFYRAETFSALEAMVRTQQYFTRLETKAP